MSSVIIAGNTSGTITLDAPNVAGTTTLTLPASTGIVAVTSSAISAAGQIPFSTNGSTLTPTAKIVSGTAVASTSGTSIDFTSIPSWVKRITVMFNAVSTSGTSNKQIQLGDSGGFETTGYLGSSVQLTDANSVNAATITSGFGIRSALAADVINGSVVITNITGNTWVAQGTLTDSARGAGYLVGGAKPLSDVLTQVRITTVNGTDAFDAGSINILYE